MRYAFTFLLLFCSGLMYGQGKGQFSVFIQAQPELTFHSYESDGVKSEEHTSATFNIGLYSGVRYGLTNRLFISAGLGYIARRLETSTDFEHGLIPPPRQSSSAEMTYAKFVAYRTLLSSVSFEYCFVQKKKFSAYSLCEISGNYLLNAMYDVTFTKYDGTYEKYQWQGFSLNLGAGTEVRISKKTYLNSSMAYSVMNTVQADDYLSNGREYPFALAHTFLRASVGVRRVL